MPLLLRKLILLALLCVTLPVDGDSNNWADGLKLPDGAFSEGELLKIPDEFLPEPPEAEFTGNTQTSELPKAATGKLNKIEEFEEKAKTKFARLAEIFNGSQIPNPLLFKTDSVALGKCISRFQPETFELNAVNIYVDVDDLLGKQIYFVPVVEENSRHLASLPEMSRAQHLTQHLHRKPFKKQFTSLQTAYPKNTPLFELFKTSLKDAFFFSYRPSPKKGQAPGGGVYFRLRGGMVNGKSYLILQRLCPYYPGCQKKGNTVVDYLNHVEPHAYCYYTKTLSFGRDANLHR